MKPKEMENDNFEIGVDSIVFIQYIESFIPFKNKLCKEQLQTAVKTPSEAIDLVWLCV